VFGSTPDNVIQLAQGSGLPVFVYASPRGVQGAIEDYLYRSIATSRASDGVRSVHLIRGGGPTLKERTGPLPPSEVGCGSLHSPQRSLEMSPSRLRAVR
jgi:hypothetical protein